MHVDLIQLTPLAYQLRGGSNAGLIVQDGQAVLVDTGLDRDTARKILRHVESLKVKLAAVVITHAHADHFGGAATIRARTGVPVYAPALEAAVIANPILEPLYLFSGAAPPAELRHKFTLAEACPVDGLLEAGIYQHPERTLSAAEAESKRKSKDAAIAPQAPSTSLYSAQDACFARLDGFDMTLGDVPLHIIPAPGHAPNQVMIAGGGVCFVADALFAPEILHKHGVPFYVDVDQTAAALAALPALDGQYAAFVPGHGAAVAQIAPWVAENAARLAEIRAAVHSSLAESDDVSCIVQFAATRLGVTIPNPVIYWLTQTTVLACLASLQKAEDAGMEVSNNRLRWLARRS
jgi:glyoxylase-like metal-dependent hydrolase (beta-lactamase superfamily II)